VFGPGEVCKSLFAAAGMVRRNFPVRVIGVRPEDQTQISVLGTLQVDALISAGFPGDPIQNVQLSFEFGRHRQSSVTVGDLWYVPLKV
jgi:hypothetical protein